MATATAPNGSSKVPLHHARVLTNHNSNKSQRKKDVKAMLASVQANNAPQLQSSSLDGANSIVSESPSKSSPSSKMLAAHVKDETLLKVKIESTVEKGKFFVPVSLLVDRELEMRKSAKDFNIRSTRWSKSRLFREWRNQLNVDMQNESAVPRTEILIQLNPEQDCLSSNQSHSFTWQPWLTTCIRAYYNTGTIRIPDECVGSDILLALEYFGILYSPDQLVFDSFGGYLRVKLWSDYFTHRAKMADWVVQKLVTTPSRHSHCFVTSPDASEGNLCFLNSTKRMQVLDGDLQLDQARYGTTPSRAVVHEFFNDDQQQQEGEEQQQQEQDEDAQQKMDGLMRQDFCAFVQASLPGTNVTFSTRQVSTSSGGAVERAVLRINLVPKPTPEGVRNPMALDKDISIQDTETTQPLTVSTQGGADKTTIARAIVMRRNKETQVLETSFEDRPHDEYTPTSSPQRPIHKKPSSVVDEPSVDQPRETLNEASDFVRSLSERIIRQTLADMDTIDHGLGGAGSNVGSGSKTSGPTLRPASATPFDEAQQQQFHTPEQVPQQHLTEDDIQKCMLPSLPSFDNNPSKQGDYDRLLTEIPFQAPKNGFSSTKLEVIGQITTPNTTPKAVSPPAIEKPAPVAHVDVVDHVKCDGSVMSALSSPFEEQPSPNPLDVRDARRPIMMEVHSGFRTPVDALSLTDDRSVRIEGQDDGEEVREGDEAVENEGEDEVDENADETEQEQEEEEEPVVTKIKIKSKQQHHRRSKSKEYVDPDEMSQEGCISGIFNVWCAPFMGDGAECSSHKRSKKRRSSSSKHHHHHRRSRSSQQPDEPTDDEEDARTPNTQSETDEEEPVTGSSRRHYKSAPSPRHRRRKSSSKDDRMRGDEMVAEIGGMADSLVTGIADSFNNLFGSSGAGDSKRSSHHSSKRRSRYSYSCKGDTEDEEEEYTLDPSTLDDTAVDEGTLDETTLDETTLEEEEVDFIRIVPEARKRQQPVRKYDRPPLPGRHRSSTRPGGGRSPSSPIEQENSLERIQDILRLKNSNHHPSLKRSANVQRNLELLQAADAPALGDFGSIGRITVVDNKSLRQQNRGRQSQERRKDSKKGLLGFLRKK